MFLKPAGAIAGHGNENGGRNHRAGQNHEVRTYGIAAQSLRCVGQRMSAAGFYHCSVKNVGRSNGRSIVAAAAYRAGERLFDEITGQYADYRARGGVIDSFIITCADTPDWALAAAREARQRLWNEAERAEPRANGRLATELELALPHELTAEQRKELVSVFVLQIVEKYGVAADVAIHAPGEGKDHRNIHAHVLITHRELGPDGFGDIANTRTQTRMRKGREVQEQIAGIAATPADIRAIRKEWEQHVNRTYERAGLDIRVDHRSHKERGIEQEPTKHLGPTAAEMERRGENSDRGDINREIEARNAAMRDRAQLEIEAIKAAAELAAAKMLAEQEAAIQPDYAAAKGRRDDIRPDPLQTFGAGAGRTTEPGIFDRDAANDAWIKEIEAAAIRAAEREAHASAKGRRDDIKPGRDAQNAQERGEHARATDSPSSDNARSTAPLGKTAGDIRTAWNLSRTAEQLNEALAARGLSVARIDAAEAYESERVSKFAKEIGNRSPVYREGELVVVNSFGSVYRFDERTTGQQRGEIDKRLAGIDAAELMNVADTTEALHQAERAAFAEERQKQQPATALEQKIINCVAEARRDGTDIKRDGETVHLTGPQAVAASLDKAGIAIVRVTAADEKAIEALREDEDMARRMAAGVQARHAQRFDQVRADEIAAVDRFGNVHRINPYKLDLADIERTLIEAQAPANGRLASVTEARASFEEQREQAAIRRTETAEQYRADAYERAMWRGDGRGGPGHDTEKDQGFRSLGGIGDRLFGGFASAIGKLFDFFFQPPPPTKAQVEQMRRADEQDRQQEPARQERAEYEARVKDILEQIRRDDMRQREQRGRGMERDDGGGREREL
jgi:hypothetical protein